MTISFVVICHYSNIFAQCVDNSNYWVESWTSCSTSQNPNQARGMSNWLLFEFDEDQAIGQTTIWNANRSGESGLGAKDVFIDVSIDGTNWVQVGTGSFTWPQGTEALDYAGFEGPDLSAFGFIKKILVTVLNNHDGTNCVSIAEFRFDINDEACYGIEDECGVCDGPGIITWYEDDDGDGLGNPNETIIDCNQPPGYVDNDHDACDNGLIGWADVQTLFVDNGCTGCHGAAALGGLDLSTFEGISTGGNRCGSEILTGNTLVGIISIPDYLDCNGEIFSNPMNERVGNAMDQNEIAMIQAWIDSGALYDCACPPGSNDSDGDGVCDASDECPNFDNSLIGTPCDDGTECTQYDVYVSECECRGEEVPDSDFDGVCDFLDFEPFNPCTADGIVGGLEPALWVANESNDCDGDGVSVKDGDQDDFDACIQADGPSLAPDCFCPGSSSNTGAALMSHRGVNTTTIYHGQGTPDGVMSSSIGFEDFVEFEFPHAEIGQEICFDVGFNNEEGGVKFLINDLGSYKFFNQDPALINFEPQTFCFPVFVAGPQLIRVTRHITGAVRVDGSRLTFCRCTEADPKGRAPSCVCPGDIVEGTGELGEFAGFWDEHNADGLPDGQITSGINGVEDSLFLHYTDLPINSEICVVVSFDNIAGKVSFELNGDYFELSNQTGSEDFRVGQNLCFLTKEEGDQTLKIKESGSGRIWIDGTYTLACSDCELDSDNDNICDEDDICPGFDDTLDEDQDGIPDGCDDCNGTLVDTPCNDNDPCTVFDLWDEDCNCIGSFVDTDEDGVCNALDQCPNFDDNLIGTPCDDGDECTLGETYDDNCGCSGGLFQDADGDGICDAEDECDESQVGTPCDDNDPCTVDDVLDTDCLCVGVFQDSDGDGICDADDDCDASQAGNACDDNDPCTIDDVLDTDCNCAGIFQDSDDDGICDAEDDCDASQVGNACDDNDPCTIDDVLDANCNCAGIFQDSDDDGICDAEDDCDENQAGNACDDNDPCTIEDVLDSDCNCAGTFADADDDGVCDEDDTCPNFDNALIGTPCDDGDVCTIGETYDDNCGCSGGLFQDADDDGICDAEDDCDDSIAGTACDDNNPCTVQDIYDTNCNCAGTFADEDEDGICDADDICPNFDDALIGTPCDDGDVCTIGETYDDNCGCSGGLFQDADNDGICDAEDDCDTSLAGTSCDDNDPCTTQDVYDTDCNCAGTYSDSDDDGVCDEEDACPNFDDQLIGTPCDDGDECTLGETYDDTCGCSGGVFQDADEDGICDAEDDCDTSLAGTACDDNDPCTAQDVYDTDCNCAGTFQDADDDGVCDEDDICPGGDDNIDIDGDGIPDFCDDCDATLNGTACDDNDPCTDDDVFDANCNCAGTFQDSDQDGVCDAEDVCPDGDDNIDTDGDGIPDDCDICDENLVGTPCDDDDPCTEQDVYNTACDCVGTFADADQDGVCDAEDICPDGDDNLDEDEDGIPDACDDCNDDLVGTPCDDNDDCTEQDLYDFNCNCFGTFVDSDQDGVCDAEDVCPGGNDNLDSDGDGIPDDCDDCNDSIFGLACDDEDDCTEEDSFDEDCNCIGIFMDGDDDGICDAEDICPRGDDNIDDDEDGIPNACDECTLVVTDLTQNEFEHTGVGVASRSLLIGNKLDPSFTISKLDANTTGNPSEIYIDLVEISYIDQAGITKVHGTYSGEDQESVLITISGVVETLIIKFQDGNDGHSGPIDIYIGDITSCDIEDFQTSTSDPIAEEADFKVYPNPTRGNFSVLIDTEFNSTYHISVNDVLGKTHSLRTFMGAGEDMIIDMNGLNLGQGVYFVTLHKGQERRSKKLVILNQ